MIAAALAALALVALPAGHAYSSTSGFTDAFGDTLRDGKVVEVHVSGRDDGRDGFNGPDGRKASFSSETAEFTFPSSSVRETAGHFHVDGRFRTHAGGELRGQFLWWFTKAR